MLQKPAIERPILTLPDVVADLLREEYSKADVILEYGSGGSTVVASEMPGKHVYSVESDRKWTRKMRGWFAENPPAAGTEVEMVWANIGTTKRWGAPVGHDDWQRYARYPLGIWQREDLKHPDVVLVDGRFRMGCVLATAFSISRPVTLLFDDYTNRKRMHTIEEFVGKPELVDRMGKFEISPMQIPAHRLMRIIRLMTTP